LIHAKVSIVLTILLFIFVACLSGCSLAPGQHPTPDSLIAPSTSLATHKTSTPLPYPSASPTTALLSPTLSPWPTTTPFANQVAFEITGQIGGYASAIAVKGMLAYLGVGTQVLILDISDPHKPKQIGQSGTFSDFVTDISLDNGLVYITAGRGGLHIMDLSKPTQPKKLAFYLQMA
jgi:hypothetical protein